MENNLQENQVRYGYGRSPKEIQSRKIKSLGYEYGLDSMTSICYEGGMRDNFQEDMATVDELKQLMNFFKEKNTIEKLTDDEIDEYRDIIISNNFPDSTESLQLFLDGYTDQILSDILKRFYEHYDNKDF